MSDSWDNFREHDSWDEGSRQWLSRAWLRLSWCHDNPCPQSVAHLPPSHSLRSGASRPPIRISEGVQPNVEDSWKRGHTGWETIVRSTVSQAICLAHIIGTSIPRILGASKPSIRRNIGKRTNSIVAYSRAPTTQSMPWLSPTAQLGRGTRPPSIRIWLMAQPWWHRMVRAELALWQAGKDLILWKDFLLADTSMKVVLEMRSPLWCGHGVYRKLVWRSNTTLEGWIQILVPTIIQ